MELKINLAEIIGKLDAPITGAELIRLGGGRIDTYPIIGRTISINGLRQPTNDVRDEGNIYIAYSWRDDSELTFIWIGHKYCGPMLQWSTDGWRNCYSNGNFGKNPACGGTWSASSKQVYPTASDAMADRDYMVGSIPCRARYTTSALAESEVIDFCKKYGQ